MLMAPRSPANDLAESVGADGFVAARSAFTDSSAQSQTRSTTKISFSTVSECHATASHPQSRSQRHSAAVGSLGHRCGGGRGAGPAALGFAIAQTVAQRVVGSCHRGGYQS